MDERHRSTCTSLRPGGVDVWHKPEAMGVKNCAGAGVSKHGLFEVRRSAQRLAQGIAGRRVRAPLYTISMLSERPGILDAAQADGCPLPDESGGKRRHAVGRPAMLFREIRDQ